MSFIEFFIIIGVFILLMFIYRNADKFVKKLKPSTVKKVNWVGFGIAAISGVAWYVTTNGIFMFLTLLGVVIYFLFYSYDKMEEQQR